VAARLERCHRQSDKSPLDALARRLWPLRERIGTRGRRKDAPCLVGRIGHGERPADLELGVELRVPGVRGHVVEREPSPESDGSARALSVDSWVIPWSTDRVGGTDQPAVLVDGEPPALREALLPAVLL
jgi:hypothetical protein